jgi:hypothetical protein
MKKSALGGFFHSTGNHRQFQPLVGQPFSAILVATRSDSNA